MSIDYEFLTSVTDINDEVWFEINNRTITPLNKESIIDVLVQNDGNSRNFGFFIQRHFENEDLSTKRIRIHYINSLNQHDMTSAHSIETVGLEQDIVSFKWLVSKKVCLESGDVKFAIEFYDDDESYQLFTKPTTIHIVEGLDDYVQITEPDSDWLGEYSTRMNKLESYVKGFKDAVDSGKFDDGYAIDTFANTIKETKIGNSVVCNGVSPIQHTVKVKITGVANPTSVKITRYGATITDNAKTYTPNADGTVSGITSLSPTMTIKADNTNAIIECEYHKDTNTVVNEAKTNIDTNARSKACAVICENNGTTVILNDGSNDKIQELKIYGKSTQDDAPTPDAPIDIISIGDKDTKLGIYGKNLINAKLNTSIGTNDDYPLYSLLANTTYTIKLKQKCLVLGNRAVQHWISFKDKNGNKLMENGFCPFLFSKVDEVLEKTYTFTTPPNTYEVHIDLGAYYGSDTQIRISTISCQLELGSLATEYENYKTSQNLTIDTSDKLCGIPVTDPSLATYTDENGQMWCADEIDLVRGVYVQRVNKWSLTFDNVSGYYEIANCARGSVFISNRQSVNTPNGLCNIVQMVGNYTLDEPHFYAQNAQLWFFAPINELEERSAKGVVKWYVNHNAKFYYILATPIETPLTQEQIEVCKSLHTNYPNTTIFNNQNAHMLVKYNADTKLYIDNAIAKALNANS